MSDQQPNQAQAETLEVADLNHFVAILTAWHARKIKVLEHFLKLEGGIEMQVGDEQSIKLEGDVLKGLKAGIQLALMEVGTLPFAAEVEEPEAAANDAAGG